MGLERHEDGQMMTELSFLGELLGAISAMCTFTVEQNIQLAFGQ